MDIHGFDRWIAPFARFFFPAKCVLCDRLLEDESLDICPTCHTAASVFMHYPWKIDHVKQWVSLWQYTGKVRGAVLRYKFWHRRSYATTFGRELADKLEKKLPSVDVVTWVPISRLRLAQRGYDQSELVAREVGYRLEKDCVKLLRKRRHNRKQSSIKGKKARTENVRGVYTVPDPDAVRGKRVLLIDDIVTTGATVSEAARMLREAGAMAVYVACIACATNVQFRPQ